MDKNSVHHFTMGDFNAKTGVRSINDDMKCVGAFGISNRLLDFVKENILLISNSFFKKAANILDMGSPKRSDQKPN